MPFITPKLPLGGLRQFCPREPPLFELVYIERVVGARAGADAPRCNFRRGVPVKLEDPDFFQAPVARSDCARQKFRLARLKRIEEQSVTADRGRLAGTRGSRVRGT